MSALLARGARAARLTFALSPCRAFTFTFYARRLPAPPYDEEDASTELHDA